MYNFDKIFKNYKNKIFRFTYNYSSDIIIQEELVQEIFYNVFLGLKKFKHKSSLSTYIYSIARNTCLNHIKSKEKDRKLLDKIINIYDFDYEKNPIDSIIHQEDVQYFLNVLDTLDDDHKEVFFLFEVENMKYKEICKILNIPMGTVKSRLNRAKEKIYNLIKENKEI